MDTLSSGLITMANGLVDLALTVVHPLVFVAAALILSMTWLALIERDELDRLGTKPEVGRH
jgi:hypothetical protein